MDDNISRQAATEHFRRIIESTSTHGEEYNEGFNAGLEFCISHISTMPPAEQRTGRWEVYEYGYYRCSECGEVECVPTIGLLSTGLVPIWDYCPHCGAKMEGETHE